MTIPNIFILTGINTYQALFFFFFFFFFFTRPRFTSYMCWASC